MSNLGTINGVPVIGASSVPWKHDDDPEVVRRCDARGLVLFDAGGKSDAIVIGARAIIWERQGERFRSFPVAHPAFVRGKQLGLWSVAVPGEEPGNMVRVGLDTVDRVATVEVMATVRGVRYEVPMRLPVRELRALVTVIGQWPGMVP